MDFNETYAEIEHGAREAGMTPQKFLDDTDKGKKLAEQYHEEISRAVGSPVADEEAERHFAEHAESCPFAQAVLLTEDEGEEDPWAELESKAKEILGRGQAKSFSEATVIAAERFPDLAQRYNDSMRGVVS